MPRTRRSLAGAAAVMPCAWLADLVFSWVASTGAGSGAYTGNRGTTWACCGRGCVRTWRGRRGSEDQSIAEGAVLISSVTNLSATWCSPSSWAMLHQVQRLQHGSAETAESVASPACDAGCRGPDCGIRTTRIHGRCRCAPRSPNHRLFALYARETIRLVGFELDLQGVNRARVQQGPSTVEIL